MKNFFTSIYSGLTETGRKIIYLVLSVASFILTGSLIFTPYGTSHISISSSPAPSLFRPSDAAELLGNEEAVIDGVANLSLILLIVLVLVSIVSGIMALLCVLGGISNETKAKTRAKPSIIIAIITTGVYCASSVIASPLAKSAGGTLEPAANAAQFIIMIVLTLVYAAMLGMSQIVEQPEKTEQTGNYLKARFRCRTELFIFALVIIALSVIGLLTNIIHVKFSAASSAFYKDFAITGTDLFTNYDKLTAGGQNIGFVIFSMLIVVGTFLLLSISSYISGSEAFYKINLTAIIVSAACSLLVGLFGKYYEIVQALNQEILDSIISGLLGIESSTVLDYKVTSASIYLFIGVVAVLCALILRRPYSKGLVAEQKLAAELSKPKNIKVSFDKPVATVGEGAKNTDMSPISQEIFDPCPTFTALDSKLGEYRQILEQKRAALYSEPSLPNLVQFIVNYARDSRLHLSYTERDIATFIAGLGSTKLTILQGMSGTGKTSLPKIFAEALLSNCEIVEVESSWRDKNELIGYYNEFSKTFTPKKFTQALYKAALNPDTLTFIVLDEMNLSRIEYYFSDFLSLMENEPDKRELTLLNTGLFRKGEDGYSEYFGLVDGNTIKIPSNVWFIGTANRDESTFEISDKVYDRAHTMNFNKRAPKVTFYNQPIAQRYLPAAMLETLFDKAKQTVKFNIDAYPVIGEVERLLAPYNISFGNRIAMQIENFVNVYCSCFTITDNVIHSAVESILLSKVVSKLELKSVENKEQLAEEFEKLNLLRCSEFILKLNEN